MISDNSTTVNPSQSAFWQKLSRQLLQKIADLRFAIILLLLIAVFSITGTVIEQEQSLDFYKENYPEKPALFGFLTWKFLLFVGLDQVYKTWWFITLLIIFGISLIACTFNRQLPALKAAKNWHFYSEPRQFQKLALSAELDTGSLNSLTPLLQQKGYKVFTEGDQIYARKGIIGRVGPIIVHASMIIILLGAIWGAFTGFVAQEIIPSGETFQIKNIFEAGIWSNSQKPKDWSVKVNRFWINYTANGKIDQFYSDLSVLDKNQKEVDHKVIHVNEPLRYQGVTLYQTDWGIAGVKIKLNKSPILQLQMGAINTPKGRIWGTWIPTKTDLSEGVSLIAKDLQGTVLIYNGQGKLINTVRTGNTIEVNGVNLTIIDLVGSTGLQIKADPGIPIVYTGFGLLMLSVMMSYVSHSQIWALQKGDRFYIGGRTNRAQVAFERELLGMIEVLEQAKS